MATVRKAVVPAAGLGTRFLPASAAVPKEMLPLGARPSLEWILEEVLQAGVEEIVLVLSPDKGPIRRYFEGDPGLVASLEARGKTDAAASLRRARQIGSRIRTVMQHEPLGLGHAVGCAEAEVGDEPFLVLLGDAPVLGESPSKALCEVYRDHPGGGVLGVRTVPREKLSRYGIVGGETVDARITRLTAMVEKPEPNEAPGNLAINGRYLLSPDVFRYLREGKRGTGNEIQLTDAIAQLLSETDLYAYAYDGTRYDIGTPEGYVEAVNAFACARL